MKEIEYERMIERERMKERELRLEKERQTNKPVSKWSEATSKFTSKPTINPLNPIENKSPFMPFPNPPVTFIPNLQPQIINNDTQNQSPSHNSIFQSQPQSQAGNGQILPPNNNNQFFPAGMYPAPIPINILTPNENKEKNIYSKKDRNKLRRFINRTKRHISKASPTAKWLQNSSSW